MRPQIDAAHRARIMRAIARPAGPRSHSGKSVRPFLAQAGYFDFFFAAPGKSDFRIIAFTPFTRSTTCVTWKSAPALR